MTSPPDDPVLQQLASLLDGAHLAAPDALPTIVDQAGRLAGWTVQVYLVDYGQRQLVPLAIDGVALPSTEDVDGTLAGRAFRTVETVAAADDKLWVPLIDGIERLGVLGIEFQGPVDLTDVNRRDQIRWFAHLVGHLVASKTPYGDSFHRARSSKDRSVASELVWSLLPPLSMACDRVVISGLLEPAEQVAGDVFDYAVQDGIAHVGMFDATGHDLHSSVIGSLALAAYRNARRAGDDLPTTAQRIDATLMGYALDTFATGLMGQLDIEAGVLRYINAGHLSPLLLRNGKVVKTLDEGRRILLGFPNRTAVVAEEKLEPNDLVVFYTDGVVEARDEAKDFFGIDRFVEVLERSAADNQVAPETLRRVVHKLLEHQHGVLQDDASILVIEWASDRALEMTAD